MRNYRYNFAGEWSWVNWPTPTHSRVVAATALGESHNQKPPNKFHYRFSPGDRVQIISGKHKGATGTVDANVFQRSVDFPNDHLPCNHVLLDNRLVITINVNQVEVLHDTLPYHQQL